MTLKELFEKRTELISAAKKILVEHTDTDGKISSRFAARYKSLETEIEDVSAQIESRLSESEKNSSQLQPLPKGILSNPKFSNPFVEKLVGYQKPGIAGDEYRNKFLNQFREGFKHALNYLREGSLPDGGFLLPEEFSDQLILKLSEENVMRQISKVITTLSTHQLNVVASEPAASWVAEGEEIQLSKSQFGRVTLSAFKLAVGTKVTNELLQDSYYDIESALIDIFGRAISAAEEDAFINGNGTSEPEGILTALSAKASSFITSTQAANIVVEDILSLYYSLKRPYRKNAVFLAGDAAINNLRRLRDATSNFLWQNSLTEGEPPTLLGAKIFTSPFMPAVESGQVPLLFGDFADYFVIGDRGDRVIKPLHELYALSDCTAYLMIQRTDSRLTNDEAVKGLKIK